MKRRIMAALLSLFTVFALVLPSAGSKADVELSKGTIVGTGVAMRSSASASGGVVTRLDAGDVVTILESNVNAEWHKVRYGNRSGYVNRIYVDISASLDSYQLPAKGTVVNCNSFINVRASANKNSKKVGQLEKGAQVTVKRSNASPGWHEIEFDGASAYVSGEYLDVAMEVDNTQLLSLEVTGGSLSPAFSPAEYGYILTATQDQITLSAKANDGVKISIGATGVSSAKYTINSGNSKTIRISVGGKVRYTIYLVRDVLTVGSWNIKRGNDSLLMQSWLLGNQQPDIMGIQEVYVGKLNGQTVNNLLSLRTRDMQNASFAPTIDYSSGQYGVGLISAFKPVSEEQFPLSKGSSKEPRTLQKVVYEIGDKTVSVYNTHFSYESAAIRKSQFAEVLKIMNADKNSYKILTGDFNAEESEFAAFRGNYRLINNSATKFYDYTGKRISMSQIDNIIVSKNITVLNARAIPTELSDHYPLIAFLRLN